MFPELKRRRGPDPFGSMPAKERLICCCCFRRKKKEERGAATAGEESYEIGIDVAEAAEC